jgi:hypothetical protein
MSNALHWLKINCMVGATSNKLQLIFLGTRLDDEAQEWYMCNVESSTHIIQQWNLETMILSLQHRFLPMLTHRHAASDFDAVHQGNGTVQELYNLMNKLADRMIHLPDNYTFRRRFIEALWPSISTKVLELSYNAKRLQQLYTTAKQLDEAKLYTSTYNKASLQGGEQLRVVQTT